MLGTILLIILILILLGALPRWRHSANWGYGPSGGIGVILIIVLILVVHALSFPKTDHGDRIGAAVRHIEEAFVGG